MTLDSAGMTSAYRESDDLVRGQPAWCCRYCRTYFPSIPGEPARECPTPGCTNPYGFGRYANAPRPKHAARSDPSPAPAAAQTTGARPRVPAPPTTPRPGGLLAASAHAPPAATSPEPERAPRPSSPPRSAKESAAAAPRSSSRMKPLAYRPMLLSAASEPFHRPGWLYEEKYDGYRILAHKSGDVVRLLSRTGRDWAGTFTDVVAGIRALPHDQLVLDGEVARFDTRLISRFDLLRDLQNREPATPPMYAAFDLLHVDGRDLTRDPLSARRAALEELLRGAPAALFCARRLAGDGLAAFAQAERAGYEGVVAKDERSRYLPGERTRQWIKVKVRHLGRFIAGAIVLSGELAGGVALGTRQAGRLRYVGTVRWGLQGLKRRELLTAAQGLAQKASPFANPPVDVDTIALQPVLEVEVQHFGWLAGRLRDPVYQGLLTAPVTAPSAASSATTSRPAAPRSRSRNR